jgi:Transmembrane domain of unknown function (DUF3566)
MWPHFADFSADNLDPGSAPEEVDVDHHGESPSWLPGTGSVGTGAGPPDLDTADDDQHEEGPAYAAGPDDSDAPGFSDVGQGFGSADGLADAPQPPDFGEGAASGFNGGGTGFGGEPSGFGGDSAGFDSGHPGYGALQGHDVFAPSSPPAFGGAAEQGSSFSDGQQGGFGDGQQGAYTGPVTGEFRGDYESGTGYAPPQDPGYGQAQDGFGAAPDTGFVPGHDGGFSQAQDAGFSPAQDRGFGQGQDGGFGAGRDGGFGAGSDGGFVASQDAGLHGGPAVGTMYGDQAYQTGRENGARPQDQGSPYPSQYPPVEPPRSRMTASLRAARRPKFSSGKSSKRNDRSSGRQAQLTVGRVEPWSVMKFSFVISLVAFIVLFVAVAVLYAALSGLGVFNALQHSVSNITSSQGSSGFNLQHYLSASRVLGYAGLLGAINVVLITALCTVGAVLYNLTANLAGGVEITLKESD